MKLKVIASGSKGNCTYVNCGNTNILIDVGISFNLVSKGLEEINFNPKDIDGILITHTHSDHIKGLASFVKKTKTKVYIIKTLIPEIKKIVSPEHIIVIDNEFYINDVNINLINTSHDVPSYGIIIEYQNKELVYVTDTGYINKKYWKKTQNKDIYVIESNYNEKMLMNGPYPYYLKQRVVGDNGHMSNHYAGMYLSNMIGNKTKYVLLAHISENNNTKELVYSEITEKINEIDFDLDNLILTDQYESTELLEV